MADKKKKEEFDLKILKSQKNGQHYKSHNLLYDISKGVGNFSSLTSYHNQSVMYNLRLMNLAK